MASPLGEAGFAVRQRLMRGENSRIVYETPHPSDFVAHLSRLLPRSALSDCHRQSAPLQGKANVASYYTPHLSGVVAQLLRHGRSRSF